ncbi:hypothetical protein [Jiangella alkaliphila]|uniref:Uncharacterized protein n=1 Tax=Jiangella alkaliphila TaxID=419479 RepID=A0A1H2HWB3_9ACTN|nr:hypothetical protein [Jiangella alkaliphila]SDU36005.1 hypothetical protein SAMN04488563_1281 [Jiangella alkaliphila]
MIRRIALATLVAVAGLAGTAVVAVGGVGAAPAEVAPWNDGVSETPDGGSLYCC